MTWLRPYLVAYSRAYGENASPQAVKRIAKGMKLLESEYPREEIAVRFARYCQQTDLRWYSVERFAETWPAWGKPKRHSEQVGVPDAYLTLEEQEIRRQKARGT